MAGDKTVEFWMSQLGPGPRVIAEELRQLILNSVPDLSEAIKWGNPVYEKGGRVCYLAATGAYVSLGFFNGASLHDSQGRMEGTGKKMRHVKVRTVDDILDEQFATWVREAVALNQAG